MSLRPKIALFAKADESVRLNVLHRYADFSGPPARPRHIQKRRRVATRAAVKAPIDEGSRGRTYR
jgi:hypothetical protein